MVDFDEIFGATKLPLINNDIVDLANLKKIFILIRLI